MKTDSKSLLKFLGKIVFTGLIIWGVYSFSEDSNPLSALGTISFGYIFASLILVTLSSIVLPGIVTFLSYGGKKGGTPLVEFIKINFSIRFYTLVLPRAWATGIRWLKYKDLGSKTSATNLVLIEKMLQIFTFAFMSFILVIFELDKISNPVQLTSVLFFFLLSSSIGVFIFFSPTLDPFLSRISSIITYKRITGYKLRIRDVIIRQRYISNKEIASIIFWSALSFVIFIFSSYAIALGFDLDISLQGIGWIRGVIFLMTLVPITIAGIGVREIGLVTFLGFYNIDSDIALAMGIVFLSIQVFLGLIGGMQELYNWTYKKFYKIK